MDTSAVTLFGELGQSPAKEPPLGVGRRELERAPVRGRGLHVAAESSEEIGAGRRQQVVVDQRPGLVNLVDEFQPCRRPVGHRDRDRTVEQHHRRRDDLAQPVVEDGDLVPVGLGGAPASAWQAAIAACNW